MRGDTKMTTRTNEIIRKLEMRLKSIEEDLELNIVKEDPKLKTYTKGKIYGLNLAIKEIEKMANK